MASTGSLDRWPSALLRVTCFLVLSGRKSEKTRRLLSFSVFLFHLYGMLGDFLTRRRRTCAVSRISVSITSSFLPLSILLSSSRPRRQRRRRRILIAISYDCRLRESLYYNRSHWNSCHYIPRDDAKEIIPVWDRENAWVHYAQALYIEKIIFFILEELYSYVLINISILTSLEYNLYITLWRLVSKWYSHATI